jgi:hypothetical protein
MTSRTKLSVEALEDRAVPASFATVMSGLDNPRGLAFGPEGAVYVAEAGRGGDGPSFIPRPAEGPPGTIPHFYGPSGAVSRLWNGRQERVVTALPSVAPASGVGATGPHDISFQGRGNGFVAIGLGADPARRALLGEAGSGLGQLVRVTPGGNWQNRADVAGYEGSANPDGAELNSNPYGVLAEPGGCVVTDAGGNSLLRVDADGTITTLAVFPSRAGGAATDSVPVEVVRGPDGAYYVGELTGVPFAVGAARVSRVVPGQAPEVVYTGFTDLIDLDFGPDGSLYVLQHATGPFHSGNGALIRIAPDGTRTAVEVDGLVLNKPAGVLVGDDGSIYVSNRGIFAGVGEVVRITLGPAEVESVAVNDGSAQRSMVTSLTVTFDRIVAIDPGAFELHRQDGTPVGLSVAASVVGGRTVAVLTFAGPGVVGGSLADGNYTLTVHGDHVRDGDGTALDGDGDGAAGGDRSDALFRLYGDSDGDRDVDLCDLGRFLSTLGRRAGDPGYLWFLDVNSDDRVGVVDLVAFARRLGSRLGP